MNRRALRTVLAMSTLLAAASSASANEFNELWDSTAEQHADAESQAYLRRLQPNALWKEGSALRVLTPPHEKALLECVTAIFPTPSPVRMIFRVSVSGAVSQALTDQAGYIAECLSNKIVGVRLPPPPRDGFLLCQRFERDAERSVVTPCGKSGWTERCEQKGTTKTCRNEFKTADSK